jgi:DNA-binding MarR family transcriptional regulator
MSIKSEDIDIIEYSLSSMKRISILLNDIETKIFNENNLTEDRSSITKRQSDLLLYLYDLPTPPSLRELSRYLATSHQNVKTICLNLESKDLIKFLMDSKDKRKQRIKITIKGEKEAYKLSQAITEVAKQITPTFSSREIDELSRLVRKIEISISEQSHIINKNSKN